MTDYRDAKNIDPNIKYPIYQIPKFIREKMYGVDVREAIAQGIERTYEDASKNGNANMEVEMARGTEPTLNDRLDKMDDKDAQVTEQLADIDDYKIGDGVLATMADLSQDVKTAMTGGSVAVVGDNAVIESNIVDKQVTPRKTSFITSSANLFNVKDTSKVSSGYYTSAGFQVSADYKTILFECLPETQYSISKVFGYITQYNTSDTRLNTISGLGNDVDGYTFTTVANATRLRITVGASEDLTKYMIVKGNVLPPEYVAYFYELDPEIKIANTLKNDLSNLSVPINVSKMAFIDDNQNIFDKDSALAEVGKYYQNGTDIVYDVAYSTVHFNCEPNTQYTLTHVFGYITCWNGTTYISVFAGLGNKKNYTFTTPNNCNLIKITISASTDLSAYMIVKGGTMPTKYSSFGYSFNIPIKGLGGTDEDKTIYLIGHFGQSNADGRATGTRPLGMSNNVYLIKNDSGTAVVTKGSAFGDDASSSAWFAHGLNVLSGKNIAIAKYALGGTQLISATADGWNPATTGVNLYNTALQTYQLAVTALENLGYTVIKVGFVWTQGESDSGHPTAEYKQALKDLITAFRTDLGVANFKCFINELGMEVQTPMNDTNFNLIRVAQNEVANEDANVYMISDVAKQFIATKLNYMQDREHYTKDGYVLLGKQGAEYAYKELFNIMYNPQFKQAVDRNFVESLYV